MAASQAFKLSIWLQRHCECSMKYCGSTVTRALQVVNGVEAVEVDPSLKTVRVQLNRPVRLDDLKDAVELVGFDCTPIKRERGSLVTRSPSAVSKSSIANKPSDNERVATLSIDGMTCASCVATVEKALLSMPGVRKVQVALLAGKASVEYVSSTAQSVNGAAQQLTSAEDLVNTVNSLGYDCTLTSDTTKNPAAGTLAAANTQGIMAQAAPVDNKRFAVFDVGGMTCASCVSVVEKAVAAVPGVEKVSVALLANKAEVTYTAQSNVNVADVIRDVIAGVGYDCAIVSDAPLSKPTTLTEPPMHIAEYDVQGMTCASCVETISNALRRLEGVKSCNVALLTGRAEVTFDKSIISEHAIQQTMEGVGFDCNLLSCRQNISINMDSIATVQFRLSRNSGTAALTDIISVTRFQNDLRGIPGVINVQLPAGSLSECTISFDAGVNKLRRVIDAISDFGFHASVMKHTGYGASPGSDGSDNNNVQAKINEEKRKWLRLLSISVVFAVPVFVLSMVVPWVSPRALLDWGQVPLAPGLFKRDVLLMLLAAPVQFYVGRKFYAGAWKGVYRGRCSMGMDFLIALGTSAAYFASVLQMILTVAAAAEAPDDEHMRRRLMEDGDPPMPFFETSALLIMFVMLGKYLETAAKGKTTDALSQLLGLRPSTGVIVLTDPAERRWWQKHNGDPSETPVAREQLELNQLPERSVPSALLHPGDVVKVYTGASIPADGVVVAGSSDVNESMLTGESMPVLKSVGDAVVGATINTSGVLYVQVDRVGKDSVLAQIVKLIEDAQMSKAPIQAVADRISGVFAPTVLVIALLTFAIWMGITASGETTLINIPKGQSPFIFSLLFSISVVVIACPCALGLATPTAVMVGTGVGAKNGILIKGGEALEIARNTNTIIFDKTGTLTQGKPTLTNFILLPGSSLAKEELVSVLASAEKGSEHPLARAIEAGCAALYRSWMQQQQHQHQQQEDGHRSNAVMPLLDVPAETFEVRQGYGIVCTVNRKHVGKQHAVIVGNRALMHINNVDISPLADTQLEKLEKAGKTAVLLAVDGHACAVAAVADAVKPEARAVISVLRSMHVDVWMVTGDNERTAAAVAATLDLPLRNVVAGVKPGGKYDKVLQLQAEGRKVAMVGDGINDSPALAAADVGIAIGAGAQIAVATADIVLMKSDLRDVVVALDLSRRVYRRIVQNFIWALGYNTLGIPLAAGILYPLMHAIVAPEVAGLAMALSSVSVVVSSLLLKRYKRPNVDALANRAAGAVKRTQTSPSSDDSETTALNTVVVHNSERDLLQLADFVDLSHFI